MIKNKFLIFHFNYLRLTEINLVNTKHKLKDAIIEIAKNIVRNDLNMLEHLFIIQ